MTNPELKDIVYKLYKLYIEGRIYSYWCKKFVCQMRDKADFRNYVFTGPEADKIEELGKRYLKLDM